MPRSDAVAVVNDRTAMIRSRQLASRFIPACAPGDTNPVIDELRTAHAAVSDELARLYVRHPWPVVLVELAEFVRRYRMPLLDGLRERNHLTETFGEQVVRETVR